MNEYTIRQLACATILQAVKDYFSEETSTRQQAKILKDLRSNWMNEFSNGTSVIIAGELERNPDEIKQRVLHHKERLQ